MELTNKRVQIDSLSSQMSSLARHHKNLLSKNNELSESIQRISQNIDQLKAVVWIITIYTIRVWKYICMMKLNCLLLFSHRKEIYKGTIMSHTVSMKLRNDCMK